MDIEISVIVPAYNEAQLLPEAIGSIRQQGWPGLEIVVVDDGSVDDTPRVLSELSRDDLVVLRQTNHGPAAARNAGILAARGEWIAFLDSDDLWLPGKLQAQTSALQNSPDAAFCYGDALCRDARQRERPKRVRALHGDLLLDLLLGPEFVTGSVLVRRSCFDELGLFDPELRTGEDWDMWIRLAGSYSSCYISRPLCVYRMPGRAGKYPSELMERCTLRVIQKALARPEIARRWPIVAARSGRLCAWHYSVLAKSHLRRKRIGSFCRLAAASIRAHPAGALFLARRWGTSTNYPRLFAP
jgi:glycosyltransferase involved in cell wall biosynthesis